MLHLDGSPHPWLALVPDARQTLIAVVDDATTRVRYAQLVAAESTETVMAALRAVFAVVGLPMALYTDRAGWAFYTPKAGGAVDKTKLTQVGRGLQRLGVEHIPAYSPQARGRSERLNRTFQDRLVNELRVAGIRDAEAANAYLRTTFLPADTATFTRVPRDPASAFVALGPVDLDQILCHEDERTVAKDNTVVLDGVRRQVPKQPGRTSCEGLRVLVRRHLTGEHTAWRGGTRLLGRSATSPQEKRRKRTDHLSNQPVTFTSMGTARKSDRLLGGSPLVGLRHLISLGIDQNLQSLHQRVVILARKQHRLPLFVRDPEGLVPFDRLANQARQLGFGMFSGYGSHRDTSRDA
jgi:hypothetical protein